MMSSFDKKFGHLKLPLTDILTATNHFSHENLLGEDGFGKEYKGKLVLSCGQLTDIVARRLDRKFGYGEKEFQTEIMMLSSLNHPNLVSIVGFSVDERDEKVIINKRVANGSLDQYLSDPVTLGWTQRLKICLDIARALSYIHYDKKRSFSVIHRDVKSSWILLGDKWEAKLSGFGLATMQPAARRHRLIFDQPCGTIGYADPTYVESATLTHKSDMYSFGVVLFQVLSGKKAFMQDNRGSMFLAQLARTHYENGNLNDIILPDLQIQMDQESLKKFSEAAYCCLNKERSQRPNIDRLIFALDQALKLQLAHEDSLALKQHSAFVIEGTSTNYLKAKNLEHLKIGYDAIKLATENFHEKYFIGKGGYGWVYKAELEHFDFSVAKGNKEELPRRRSTVALKYILNRDDGQGEQGFLSEIETLGSCMHPNIVSLLGFCYEPPHMILVYEYLSNGSLDDYLGSEGKMINLTWVQRIKICIDIALGLDYIHTTIDNKLKIIHRDIKSDNILLNENWKAKIADFGLSKLYPPDHTASTIYTNKIAGTQVYLDPEYERTGKLKKESDVYSFGVVLFEILSGRPAYDSVYINENEKGLAPIVRQHFEKGTIKEIVDPSLEEESKGPNQDSLNTFLKIGYRCLQEKQADRPTMKVVIEELAKALNFQETPKGDIQISLQDIKRATQNFSDINVIGRGGFGRVYRGEILLASGPTPIAVKRLDREFGQGEKEFMTEVEILFEYKHENIIGLVGYCDENDEKILVYEYASKGSLDMHLKDATLTWTQRLKIGIDVAMGLEFLHGGDYPVIHRDIKSGNILLNGDWKAKITDFGLSMITPLNNEIDFVVENAAGTPGYCDPLYMERGFLTRESDIYSLGVVLFEMMCGGLAFSLNKGRLRLDLIPLVKLSYEEGKLDDELVLEGIKDKIVPKSLTIFQTIAYQCLHLDREERPTASEVVLQLNKALEFQEDTEIWEPKLPSDYKEILHMSKNFEIYSNKSNKDLYRIFSNGVLLREGKVILSAGSNGERNEMISATTFSYDNRLHKRRSIQKSRFQRVLRITDITNLKTQVKIKTRFLTPNVVYGASLIFKFCDPRKVSNQPIYVNLKYKLGSETLHAYFAAWGDDEWLMIELGQLLPCKKDVNFEVLLESMSRHYCGNGGIYIEGIHFRATNDATLEEKHEENEKLKGVQVDFKLSSDSEQQVPVDNDRKTQPKFDEKLSEVNGKKCHMLPAKMVLYEPEPSTVKCFKWKSLIESRGNFEEVAEFLSHQIFEIKCQIETQKLSVDTNYACYLVFMLSEKCHGLHCPVKVQDLLLRKKKEFKVLYFRSPRFIHLQGNGRVPKHREDGLMEVIVWEFNSGNNDHVPMSLKLRCYEGNMSGLIVYGIEFRPV